ncbi:MAG: nuclease-related domain-containing protein [Promethearchaeota archaeon]
MESYIVLKELSHLPSEYYIFENLQLSLLKGVKYRNTSETVRICQIDYLIVGPRGIFIIGVKDWDKKTLEIDPQLPLKEVDKAGLIIYIRSLNRFKKKLPIYNVSVRLRKVPKVRYEYVYHVTLRELYWFILRREGKLQKKWIAKIVRWISKITKSKPIKMS